MVRHSESVHGLPPKVEVETSNAPSPSLLSYFQMTKKKVEGETVPTEVASDDLDSGPSTSHSQSCADEDAEVETSENVLAVPMHSPLLASSSRKRKAEIEMAELSADESDGSRSADSPPPPKIPKKTSTNSITGEENLVSHASFKTQRGHAGDQMVVDKVYFDEKFANLGSKISDLTNSLRNLTVVQKKDGESETKKEKDGLPNYAHIELIKKCKTLSELGDVLLTLKFKVLEDHASCIPCERVKPSEDIETVKVLPGMSVTKIGHFSLAGLFPCNLDESEEIEKGLTDAEKKRFHNLKRNLVRHFRNQIHIECVAAHGLQSKKATQNAPLQFDIGMRVIRVGYSSIKSGLGGKHFEREVNVQDLNGVDVGELNHSREFYRTLRTLFHDVINEEIIQYLQTKRSATHQLPLFSLTADKITLQRRTLQITSAVAMVEGIKHSILIDLIPCGISHTGESLTNLLKGSMQKMQLQLKQQLTGLSFDGQYIDLHVPEKISELADLDSKFLMPIWDPAHKVELAMNNTRDAADLGWLREQVLVIGNLMKSYKWGISYEIFIATAEELKIHFLSPNGFQTTRFVQSEFRVYEAFIRDFRIFFVDLSKEREKAIQNVDNTKAKELQQEIKKFSGATFVFQLLATSDILDLITQFSCLCQEVNGFIWDIHERFTTLIGTLEQIVVSLDKNIVPSSLKRLSTHIKDLGKSQFQNNLLDSLHTAAAESVDRTRSKSSSSVPVPGHQKLMTAFANVSKFVKKLKSNLEDRIQEPELVKEMRICFSWKNILRRTFENTSNNTQYDLKQTKEALMILLDLLNKNRGTKFVFSDVLNQYNFLRKSLEHIPFVNINKLPDKFSKADYLLNKNITQYIFVTEAIYKRCPDALFLFENYNKLFNETICETVGSVVGAHLYNRKLKNENLYQEVFTAWNGPSFHCADKICESVLERRFKGKPHFKRITKQKSKLKLFKTSLVIDHLRKREEERNLVFLCG